MVFIGFLLDLSLVFSVSTIELRIHQEDQDCDGHAIRALSISAAAANAIDDDHNQQDNNSGYDANNTTGDVGR